MSVEVMSLVWKNFPGTSSELLTMLACGDWCNDEGGSLFPSIAAVAARTRVSESQARRNMHRLIAEGWIAVVANEKGGLAKGGMKGATRHYQVNVERLRTHANAAEKACTDATLSPDESLAPVRGKGRTDAQEGSHSYDTRTVITHQKEHPPKKTRARDDGQVRFPEFWDAYPVKTAEKDARAAWKKAALDGRADEVVAGVNRLKSEDARWAEGYVPSPEKFLAGERWRDQPQRAARKLSPAERMARDHARIDARELADIPQGASRPVIEGAAYRVESSTTAKASREVGTKALNAAAREQIEFIRHDHHFGHIDDGQRDERIAAILDSPASYVRAAA